MAAPKKYRGKIDDSKVRELVARADELRSNRTILDDHCKEIAERVCPGHSTKFSSATLPVIEGEKRSREMFDSTAAVALPRFAAALESLLVPKNNKWQRLMATDPDLMKIKAVAVWFDAATDILFKHRYAPLANFQSQVQEVFASLGLYGTGMMFLDDLVTRKGADGLRYKSLFLGNTYFLQNHQGITDTVYRFEAFKPRQMVQKFGDNVPTRIKEMVDTAPDTDIEVIHVVAPNEDRITGRLGYKGMDYYSCYVTGEYGGAMLQEGGYTTFPIMVTRYNVNPGEIYGTSPAMMALPAIKTLNEQKRSVLKQGQRIVDPVLLAHDDGVLDGFSLKSGAINAGAVSADGRPLIHTLPTGNLNIAERLMEDERRTINDSFLITLFQILVDSPQMTATEVMERSREKGALFAPTIGRQEAELTGPETERALDILSRQGKLPPMPMELMEARGEYKITYDTPLARMQRADEAAGTMRTMQWAAEMASMKQDPSVLDSFNTDVIIPDLAYLNAMPARYMRDPDEIAAIRAGRQQQAATQQLVDSAPAMASMLKQGVGAPV